MDLSGPQHAKKVHDLLWKAKTEKNATEKALLLQEASVHAAMANLAAVVHGGGATEEQVRIWKTHGVRM